MEPEANYANKIGLCGTFKAKKKKKKIYQVRLSMNIRIGAPIGPWKCNFPPSR